jgi:hypothetical protein
MKKIFLAAILLLLLVLGASAQTIINANSCSASDIQTALNSVSACNTIVKIPSCSATSLGTGITASPPTGCPAFTGTNNPALTIEGANTCQFGCGASSGGISGSGTVNSSGTTVTYVSGTMFNTGWTGTVYVAGKPYTISSVSSPTTLITTGTVPTLSGANYVVPMIVTDNTNLTLAASGVQTLNITGAANTAFVRLTGMTLTPNSAYSNGLLQLVGAVGTLGYRIDHIHIKSPNADPRLFAILDMNGLSDHLLYQDSSAGPPTAPFEIYGDFGTDGFSNWLLPNPVGTENEQYVEDSFFYFATNGTEGVADFYTGGSLALRYSYGIGSFIAGGHGYDSGETRGTIGLELYSLTWDNPSASSIILCNWRSGTGILENNTFLNSGGGGWSPCPLAIYRVDQPTDAARLGTGGPDLNWEVNGIDGVQNTLGASDWQASNAYAADAVIGPTSNNSGTYNYKAVKAFTSGGSRPNPFNQTISTPIPVTAASESSTTVTITSTLNPGTGTNNVACMDITPSGYNGLWSVTASNATSFQFTAGAGLGAGTLFGTCFVDLTIDNGSAWANAGGVVATSSPQKFLSTDNETQCVSGGTCTRYVDNTNGTKPFRDQPGYGPGQVSAPIYACNNTISGLTGSIINVPNAADAPYLISGTDFFPNTCSPTWGSGFTYPHPFQGTAPAPATSYSPSSLAFGNQAVTTTSSPQTIVLTNTGTATLSSIVISLTGTGAAAYTLTGAGTCSSTLAASASCNIVVTFTPTSAISYSANVNVASNAASSPDLLPLTGTGVSSGGSPVVTINNAILNNGTIN